MFGTSHPTDGCGGVGGFFAGLTHTVPVLAGSEAAAPLAGKTRDPRHRMRGAVLGAALTIGPVHLRAFARLGPRRRSPVIGAPRPGDGHARQGETCGVAVECAMNTVVLVELLNGTSTPWPRTESDSHPMSAASARPLEGAPRISQLELVRCPNRGYGLSELDACQPVRHGGEAPSAHMYDTNPTSVAKTRTEWQPVGDPHRGIHRPPQETVAPPRP
ncbi:hypothetical protein ACFYXM_34830 [Streptomyces sp. NPDC002476]|uniref:hypothetical protein n=1 Tax=Streptomyces sp. NPDC002476 TaxID=3364648 RepID=UPI0036CD5B3E